MAESVEIDSLDFDIDQLLAEFEKFQEVRALRRDNPYVRDLIKVLQPHRRGIGRSWVMQAMERQRKSAGLPIPPNFEGVVQSAYNSHSTDSVVWKKNGGHPEDGIFFSPEGKGSGKWAVDIDRAREWLRARLMGEN